LLQKVGELQSIKFFSNLIPVVGYTDVEAFRKPKEAKKYVSTIGGLVLVKGYTGIVKDFSRKAITTGDNL
jgi:hypothetical protein